MAASGNEQLVVHAVGDNWPWAVIDRHGRVARQGIGPADRPDDLPVTVLLDAAHCMGLVLELPEMSHNRLQRALRWAAEEHLAAGADDQHVVAGPRDRQGRLCCVVVDEAVMAGLLETFDAMAVEKVLPDALCLPRHHDEISLAATEHGVLARWDDWAFGSFETELADELIASAAADDAERVFHGGEPPAWLGQRSFRDASVDRPLIAILADGARERPINLLTGPYSPRSAVTARSHWRWASIVAGLTLVLAVVAVALETRLLSRQADVLEAEIEQQFAAAFPDAGRMVRPREQAERELARLRFGEAAGMLDLMSRTAPVIEGQEQLRLQSLNYRDGELELTLQAPDVAALDQLERRLRALDLVAEVRSASVEEDRASGRIRVTESGQ